MSPQESGFDPRKEEYEEVEDLPEEKQGEFEDVPEEAGGGFVREEAYEPVALAKIRSKMEEEGENFKEILKEKLEDLQEEAIKLNTQRDKFVEKDEINVRDYRDFIGDQEGRTVIIGSRDYELDPEERPDHPDRELMLHIMKKGTDEAILESLEDAPDRFQEDEEIIINAIKKTGGALKYASDKLQDDKEIAMEAIKQQGTAIRYASDRLKNDKEVALKAIESSNRSVLKHVSKELKNDKKFVLEAFKKESASLRDVPENLQDDKEVVLAAIKNRSRDLESASNELKKDKDVVLEAVKQDGRKLQYASDELQDDKEVVLEAVKESGSAFAFVSENLKDDKKVVIEAIRNAGKTYDPYENTTERLQDDKEVMTEYVRNNTYKFGDGYYDRANGLRRKDVPEKLLDDKEVMKKIVKKRGRLLKFASEEIKSDPDIVLKAIDGAIGISRKKAFKSAPESLRYDYGFLQKVAEVNPEALAYAPDEIKEKLGLTEDEE